MSHFGHYFYELVKIWNSLYPIPKLTSKNNYFYRKLNQCWPLASILHISHKIQGWGSEDLRLGLNSQDVSRLNFQSWSWILEAWVMALDFGFGISDIEPSLFKRCKSAHFVSYERNRFTRISTYGMISCLGLLRMSRLLVHQVQTYG